MRGKQLEELFKAHGGVKSIHTRPVKGGWANTYVAHDGYTRTLTRLEDLSWSDFLDKQDKKTNN